MMFDVHSQKINIPLNISSSGDNVILAGESDKWFYIHEIVGTPTNNLLMQIKSGTDVLHEFNLQANQGTTISDIPGEEGSPRFRIRPGQDFIINLDTPEFVGGLSYSIRQ